MTICIIAGKGDLPKMAIKKLQSEGKKFQLVLIADQDYDDEIKNYSHQIFPFGYIGHFLKFTKKNKISKIVMVGSVKKPSLSALKFDKMGMLLASEILKQKLFGDDNLLSTIVNFFEKKGLKIIGIEEIIDNLLVEKGVLGNIKPNKGNFQDINSNNISLFLGSNLHSVSYPINNSSRLNYVSILRKKLTEKELFDHSLFENKDFISSILSEISKQIDLDIVENLKDIKCFPVFVSSEVYQPTNKNTFLIGDAFFALPPTFAQGASQSIEVAHEIYKNLEGETNQFNNERIKRIKMINTKSKFNYFAFHLSNPLIIWIRNIVMSYLVKNKKFINNYLGKIYKD